MSQEITLRARLSDIIAEYDRKMAEAESAVRAFEEAGTALKVAGSVAGEFGNVSFNVGHTNARELAFSLKRSAWKAVWNRLSLPTIASATDKRKFELAMADPPPCDMDTIRATFGAYIENPRASILRGLAEVFADLDPAFKSHEKVKIGVKGLPKRVILRGFSGHLRCYGIDRVSDVLNALAAYQGKPLMTWPELDLLSKDGTALKEGGTFPHPHVKGDELTVVARDVELRKYANGNGHLFFGPKALRDINKGLAEYYGEVLADCSDDTEARPAARAGTEAAKDLQYYPTPAAVVSDTLHQLGAVEGLRVLEPSCGCGRFLDALRDRGARVVGIEVHPVRASMCEAKGHSVARMNFLEVPPEAKFDLVVMNPPFYGKHYAKHVRHALRFLKPNGRLVAILPATARYDHGLLDDLRARWSDLPVGAFSESGTNIFTTRATIFAPR